MATARSPPPSCMAAALSEEEAAVILNGDGVLDRDEFLRLASEAELAGEGDIDGRYKCLREAFRMYAAEGEAEQCITPASLRRMLSRLGLLQLGMEECKAMICRFDLNGDGVLSFDEFRIMMQDGLM